MICMKLNHFVCPSCSHDFYAEGASVKCDACQCCFYALGSKTSLGHSFATYVFPFNKKQPARSHYRLNMNYSQRGKRSHRIENLDTIFMRLLKIANKTGMRMSRYEEVDGYANIEFERR